MNFVNVNGRILAVEEPAIAVTNRGYRYGDGLFETMKCVHGRLILEDLHFERLFDGLAGLKIPLDKTITREFLHSSILELCERNHCMDSARIRLSVHSGDGNITDPVSSAGYVIECRPLDPAVNSLDVKGMVIDTCSLVQKYSGWPANLKTSSALCYAVAARYARENSLDDALLLNEKGNVVESAIANLFLVNGRKLVTPSLQEGCVAGVMRRYLLARIAEDAAFDIDECAISVEDVLDADELFLTNAIRGTRPVTMFRNKKYLTIQTSGIYRRYIQPLYA